MQPDLTLGHHISFEAITMNLSGGGKNIYQMSAIGDEFRWWSNVDAWFTINYVLDYLQSRSCQGYILLAKVGKPSEENIDTRGYTQEFILLVMSAINRMTMGERLLNTIGQNQEQKDQAIKTVLVKKTVQVWPWKLTGYKG